MLHRHESQRFYIHDDGSPRHTELAIPHLQLLELPLFLLPAGRLGRGEGGVLRGAGSVLRRAGHLLLRSKLLGRFCLRRPCAALFPLSCRLTTCLRRTQACLLTAEQLSGSQGEPRLQDLLAEHVPTQADEVPQDPHP